jgi:hypothetical protein
MSDQPRSGQWAGKRRRWFLDLEPIFEAGRKGKRAQIWDVEDELIAVALLGDVTIDLSQARSVPREIAIDAYAILRRRCARSRGDPRRVERWRCQRWPAQRGARRARGSARMHRACARPLVAG